MSNPLVKEFEDLRKQIEDATIEFITLRSTNDDIAQKRGDELWERDVAGPASLFEQVQQLLSNINLSNAAAGIGAGNLNTILQTNIQNQPLFNMAERNRLKDLFNINGPNDIIQGKVILLRKIYDLMLLSLIQLKAAVASLGKRIEPAMQAEIPQPKAPEPAEEEVVSLPPPPPSVFTTTTTANVPPAFPSLPEMGEIAATVATTAVVAPQMAEKVTQRKRVFGTRTPSGPVTVEERSVTFMDTSDLTGKGGEVEETVTIRNKQGNIISERTEVSPLQTFSPESDLFSQVDKEIEFLQTPQPQGRRLKRLRRISEVEEEEEIPPPEFPQIEVEEEELFGEEMEEVEPSRFRFRAQAIPPNALDEIIALPQIDEQIRRNELAMRDQDIVFRDDLNLNRRRQIFEQRVRDLEDLRDSLSLGNIDPNNIRSTVDYVYDLTGEGAAYGHGPYRDKSSARENYDTYISTLNQYQADDIPLSYIVSATRGIASEVYKMGCCGKDNTYSVDVLRLSAPSSLASNPSKFAKKTPLSSNSPSARFLSQRTPSVRENTYLVFAQPWNETVIHSRYEVAFREYVRLQGLSLDQEPDRGVHIGFVRYVSPLVVLGWTRALSDARSGKDQDPVFADIIYCGKTDAPCYGVTMAIYQVPDADAEALAEAMEYLPYDVDKNDDQLESLAERIQTFTMRNYPAAHVNLKVRPNTQDTIAVNVKVDEQGYSAPQARAILEGTYGLVNNYGYAVDQDNSSIQVDERTPQRPLRAVLERPFVPY